MANDCVLSPTFMAKESTLMQVLFLNHCGSLAQLLGTGTEGTTTKFITAETSKDGSQSACRLICTSFPRLFSIMRVTTNVNLNYA